MSREPLFENEYAYDNDFFAWLRNAHLAMNCKCPACKFARQIQD